MASRHPPLTDGVLTLREVTWDDCRRLYDWRMEEQTRRMFRNTALIPYEQHEAMLQHYLAQPGREGWFILEREGVPVGAIGFSDFSEDGTDCEIGRLIIDDAHRGKGYGTRGMILAVEQARREGVRRIHLELDIQNVRSRRIQNSMGFVETGTRMYGDRTYLLMVGYLDPAEADLPPEMRHPPAVHPHPPEADPQ